MSPTELYQQNLKTIRGKAREFHRQAPHISIEEFESEANEVFVKCLISFNPSRNVSFSTYLNMALKNNLTNFLIYFVMDWIELREYLYEKYLIHPIDQQNLQIDFPNWIKNLSKKSQQVISIIFKTDIRKISNVQGNKITKRSLTEYLRNKNWKYTDILNCFNEISLALERI